MSSGRPDPRKPTKLLNEREFHKLFFIPNGVSIQLVEGDLTSTEKIARNAIFFSKEQFNAELRFLFRPFSSSSCTIPKSLQPISILISSGC